MLVLERLALQDRSLRQVVSEPGYSGRVIQLVQGIAAAQTPSVLLELLFDVTVAMGADSAAFVSHVRGDFAHETFRFVLACDPRWCFEYKTKAAYADDPWILYASSNSEPICASEIPALTKPQREVRALAIKYGMASALVVPAPSGGAQCRVGMLAIGSKREGYFEGDGAAPFQVLARSLSMELQGWWVRRLRKEMIDELGITAQDLQLLGLERFGFGTKEAATELGLSLASVDSRWQRLNRKLNTPNRAAAARFSVAYGLI